MALLSSTKLTLAELAKRIDDSSVQTIAEVLNETNEFLADAVWIEGNQPGGHKGTIRQTLPSGTWRKLNDGVTEERSETRQITESCGILEALSKVDVDLASMASNPQQFRATEDVAFLEGMGQEFASTFIYGNADTDPEEFNGLAPRLNDLSYGNVYNNGGSGSDLTSIYIVQWGVKKTHFIYPKNSKLGLSSEDLGKMLVDGEDSGEFLAWVTDFKIKPGLFVHDARSVIRIANIETPSSSSNSFDDDTLLRALRTLPNNGRGAVIYANSTLLADMDIDIKDKSNVNYQPSNGWGLPTEYFRGVPVRQMDAILNTESAVT